MRVAMAMEAQLKILKPPGPDIDRDRRGPRAAAHAGATLSPTSTIDIVRMHSRSGSMYRFHRARAVRHDAPHVQSLPRPLVARRPQR